MVEKVKGASPQPDIEYLEDLGSGTRNEELTPGNIAQVRGSRLKFDPADPAHGIFLVAAGGAETKVATIAPFLSKKNEPCLQRCVALLAMVCCLTCNDTLSCLQWYRVLLATVRGRQGSSFYNQS